jgi:ligand-binding sensor protein
MAMSDYTQIEDYDCPECDWSLHVEKRVWSEMDNHSLVIDYIQSEVKKHDRTHKTKMYEGLTADIGDSPYLYVSPRMDK